MSPLHLATISENESAVMELLEDPETDVNIREAKQGMTPLMLAVSQNQLNLAMSLVEQEANTNVQDYQGRTCLYIAVQSNNLDLTSYLIDNGANANISDIDDVTPLHIAAAMGNVQMVRALVSRGAWVNLQDNQGETPLFYAIRESHSQVVRILVEYGADVNVENVDKETPIDFALSIGDTETAQFLSGVRTGNLSELSARNHYLVSKHAPLVVNKSDHNPWGSTSFASPGYYDGKQSSSPSSVADDIAFLSLRPTEVSKKSMDQTLMNKWVVW
eukprot:TRINITY_DN738_c0_g1_i1.p1 TRINITY_DN738_c0_g1~~TRINITY_DN738_c0_g1_i1.p1  ORF type:complete len:321 (-),score=57.11 TRINITY_DN738_c0_g1_i1:173-994(-)